MSSFRGNGRRGGGSSRPPTRSGQACRQFQSTGRCTFGSRCRFSHDPASASASSSSSSSKQKRAPRTREPTDDRVSKFKRLVAARTYGTSSHEQNVFALGLDILTNVDGADAQQQVVSVLATDNGLACILQLVEARIPRAMAAATTFAKRRIWETDMRPLFSLITSERVVLSNILHDKVAAIYNFLAGVGGARLPAWFDLAHALAEAPDRPPTLATIDIAQLCLAVLSKMMDCNPSHVSNPVFRGYAARFIAIAAAVPDGTAAHKMAKIQATEHAAVLSRRLEAADTSAPASGLSSLSSLHQDLPGALSGNGPRHDNDHDDITRIAILPTPGEIASDRKEYLPAVDASLWHRAGIAGRLDREFRLLREDTIGQLRDVVRTELGLLQHQQHQQHQQSSQGRPPKDTIQYCTYHDTSITDVGFDRRTGPEFVFRFRQPAGRSGAASLHRGKAGADKTDDDEAKSLAQRRDWWMVRAKKRLQPGGLVCVIDAQGASHFLIVADSTERSAADAPTRNGPHSKSGQHDDEDAPSGTSCTLADDPQWSYVRLKLPPDNNKDQLRDILTQLFFKTKIKRYTRPGAGWRARAHEPSCVLVEFPGILLDSFLPTLQALQTASTSLNVPFADLLAPSDHTPTGTAAAADGGIAMASIPPPKYAQQSGFKFSLHCLAHDAPGTTRLLAHSVDAPTTAAAVAQRTRLDATQSAALVDALSRSVALVQGPPGTGKTFAGVEILKVLLQNSGQARLGPILIVCYTNHALDQLLEHVLDARPKTHVVRMGSRSKSERLQQRNLYDLSRAETRTVIERSSLYELGNELDERTKDVQGLSDKLTRSMSFNSLAEFLQKHHVSYAEQLFGADAGSESTGKQRTVVDDEGFVTVQKSKDKIFVEWMRGTSTEDGGARPAAAGLEPVAEIRRRLQLREEAGPLDLLALSADERSVLYQQWQYASFSRAAGAICDAYTSFVSTKKSYDYARRETDLRCLQGADIVGVTTTGLARNIDLLKNLRSKVLLCEEAGEVLEAHMLTSLLPSLEHLILIGDHQQLRPQVQNYSLRSDSARGAQYSFDMSLFERLVAPPSDEGVRLPFSQLFTQRRMHPSISDLIRAPLYPSLQDGPNVHKHPDVPGIERRLFWLQHDQLEQGASRGDRQADPTSTSRTNLFEVEMTAALVSHLFKQGAYGPGDIAVLTPYLGQMMLLQRRMSSMFEISFNERDEADMETMAAVQAGAGAGAGGADETSKGAVIARKTLSSSVRIATVDNFQGEEAKVVVVSMVRSNEQHRCGFLSTSNRINVLLSRAKHGMYIIGNSDTCSHVPMWQQVIRTLDEGGNIGPALPLRCPRHPERRFEASQPQHFLQFAPDGGCLEPCNKPLLCKHICRALCHSDVIHTAVQCAEPCARPQKGCRHPCPRTCSDACPPRCLAVLSGQTLQLKCGHPIQNPACWQAQKPEAVKCLVNVSRTVPGCSHAVTVKCGLTDVKDEKYTCRAPCGSRLPCGHACSRSCYECNTRQGGVVVKRSHGACQDPCGARHETCAHSCNSQCHADAAGGRTKCPPCAAPCSVRCSHGPCRRKCSEPCMPCTETDCASHCPHAACTLPCAAPCNWIPCSKRCAKKLPCGHPCPSLCGEPCPTYKLCQVCCSPETRAQQVDLASGTTYGSTNLDEDPCLFLGCGHIVAVSFMDNVASMATHYEMDAGTRRSPAAIKTPLAHFATTEASISCPHCRERLDGVARYSRIVKQRQWDLSVQKAILLYKERLAVLATELEATMTALLSGGEPPIATSRNDRGSGVWRRISGSSSRTSVVTKLLMPAMVAHYRPLLELRDRISAFSTETRKHEQACQIATGPSPAQEGGKLAASASSAGIRMGGHLQARLLLLRCDAVALFVVARSLSQRGDLRQLNFIIEAALSSEVVAVVKDNKLTCFFTDCALAIEEAQQARNTRQENEAKAIYASLYLAHGVLGELMTIRPLTAAKISGLESTQEWKAFGQDFNEQRRKLHMEYTKYTGDSEMRTVGGPLASYLKNNAAALTSYLMNSVAEVAASYKGMGAESHGMTGRWYVCANGHPCTTKGDTLSRETKAARVRCPECNAPAGGQLSDRDAVEAVEAVGRHMEKMHV